MSDTPSPRTAEGLTRLLDKLGADLANDLEWALDVMERFAGRLGADIYDANRYADARMHLRARRAFERACEKELSHG